MVSEALAGLQQTKKICTNPYFFINDYYTKIKKKVARRAELADDQELLSQLQSYKCTVSVGVIVVFMPFLLNSAARQ